MKRFIVAAVVLFAVPVAHAAQPGAAAGTPFRAGAARIDFTPEQLPRNMVGVLDPIFVRALVLDNGSTRAALVSVDAGSVSNDLFAKVSARAAQELNIPATQLMISATHTHSVPFQAAGNAEEKIMQGLRESVARLQPARVAWGTGQSYINVNRDRVDPVTNRWWEGPNYDGVSDKTVAVVRVETPAGQPIAVYYNYAVHAVLTGTLDKISGDIPGATSRYVEASLGGNAVALWFSGAAGDQNPLYFNQTDELRETDALREAFVSGGVEGRCGAHKRLYSFVEDYDRDELRHSAFAGLAEPERAAYFLDPWNSPYWIRHLCTQEDGRSTLVVYSFGPDRRRNSLDVEIEGDDVGARAELERLDR
jgi:hypothetical protein